MISRFAVVIPYFQRQPGVLRRTLQSVASQDIDEGVNVYIVDDGSPCDGEVEINSVAWPSNIRPRLIRQANKGVAAARNKGLDCLGDEQFVAFLDSDDQWMPHHLSSAREFLGKGFDFYTADWYLIDEKRLSLQGFYGRLLNLEPLAHSSYVYELNCGLMELAVDGPIGSTCSMVITRDLLGETRFDERLRSSGEDGLFATALGAKNPRVAVSTRPDVSLGRGVNIFSTGGWRSLQALIRSENYLLSRHLMFSYVGGDLKARLRLKQALRKGRIHYFSTVLSYLWHSGLPPVAVFRVIRIYPLDCFYFLGVIFRLVFRLK